MRKRIIIVIALFFLVFLGFKTARLIPLFFQIVFNHNIVLKKEDDRVNLLFLGVAGGRHEGPNLTDTILFISLNSQKNKVTLISVPRDLWTQSLQGKINTAYEIGEKKRQGGGLILAQSAVSNILNQQIHYSARIDFNGFTKAVDLLGGIEVNLERSFDDYQYPIDGKENDTCGYNDDESKERLATASSQLEAFPCRYNHIHFGRGVLHLDGTQALEVVRSRHAEGDEGTDFARSKRQETVIKGVKDKIFSLNVLLDPGKIIGLYDLLKNSIDTNIKEDEIDDFLRLFQKMKNAKIESAVLDYGDEKKSIPGLLINPPLSTDYDGQWVLIPRLGNGNFSEIQKYVDCEIKIGNCPI